MPCSLSRLLACNLRYNQPNRRLQRLCGHEAAGYLMLQLSQYSSTTRTSMNKEMSTSSQSMSINFLTDVEGDGVYFDRFVNHSKILGFRYVSPTFGKNSSSANKTTLNLGEYDEDYFPYDREVIFIDDGLDSSGSHTSMLVYGGDVCDKGGADLYVLRQLLSLHQRYPARVHFLMGNRDINKMRIVDELGACTNEGIGPLPKHEGVYWLHLPWSRKGSPGHEEEIKVPSQSAAERLKWMLQKTMGSVDAFELRRNELRRERIGMLNGTAVSPSCHQSENSKQIQVSDDEVAESYIRSCCPVSGIMSQYLTNAKLAMRVGSVLFVHGALPLTPDYHQAFPTPWIQPRDDATTETSNSLSRWIDALNEFASSQVNGWKDYHAHYLRNQAAQEGGAWATEGGYFNNTVAGQLFGALMQYGMGTLPDRTKTQSVVYNSWMNNGMPRDDLFGSDEQMSKLSKMLRQGVQVIISGHQPVGDSPWPIQVSAEDEDRIWIVPCDTSFAGDSRWTRVGIEGYDSSSSTSLGRGSVKSGRGEVVFSEPIIQVCPTDHEVKSLHIHGCLSDGTHYETSNLMNVEDKGNLLLGRKLGEAEFEDEESSDVKGTFWIKGKVGSKQLASFGRGFDVWNTYISARD